MFLHLGGNTDILNQEIIAILNYQSICHNSANEYILDRMKNMHPNEKNKIKSVILTREEIYFSPISSLTLQQRANLHGFKGEEHDQ